MHAMEKEVYLTITKDTEVFRATEIEVLEGVLEDWQHNPVTNYILFDEKRNDTILGFIIFGRTPMTEFSWDIYWLVVDKSFQRRGVGKILLKRMQVFIAKTNRTAIVRVETSGRNECKYVRNFYKNAGFTEAARIPDFYSQRDDLVIFFKKI